jgi:hypothetical protein
MDSFEEACDHIQPITIHKAQFEVNLNWNRRSRPQYFESRKIDNTVNILEILDKNSEPLVRIVRYTCHPTCFGSYDSKIDPASADFVGLLRSQLGDMIFLNGCAGYVNPYDHSKQKNENDPAPDLSGHGYDGADFVAQGIFKAFSQVSGKSVDTDSTLKTSRRDHQCRFNTTCSSLRPTKTSPVAAVRIGSTVLVGLPGEPFEESGSRIKKQTTSDVWVIGYADGYFGYLIDPTAERRAKEFPNDDYEGGAGQGMASSLIGYRIFASDTALLEDSAIAAVKDTR